jgi:hypothetical protein
MKKFKIIFRDVAYKVNSGLKAAFTFEKPVKKPLELKTAFGITLYAYSILRISEAFTESGDNFIDCCDENDNFVSELFKKIPVPGNANVPTA